MRATTVNVHLLTAAILLLTACGSEEPREQPLAAGVTEPAVAEAREIADVVYRDGRIYTVNQARPWAEAVSIKDGTLLVVGSNADVDATAGESTRVVELGGKFVMPGIVDMHAHPFTGVDMGTGSVNLSEPDDLETVLADIKQFVAEHPDRDVFLGGNWSIGGALFETTARTRRCWTRSYPMFLSSFLARAVTRPG